MLPEFGHELSSIKEIQELVSNYNRAAASVRVAQETLQAAYVEFVGSLASALDARDPYTAGHSRRVSDWTWTGHNHDVPDAWCPSTWSAIERAAPHRAPHQQGPAALDDAE